MPAFPPLLARLARFTVLVAVGFLLLWAAAWKGWILPSDRQYLPRRPDPAAVAVPDGYRVEVLATGLNAPSSLEVTPDGRIFIGESGYGGSYGSTAAYEGTTPGRILQLHRDGTFSVRAGGFKAPLSGFFHDAAGTLFVSHLGTVTRLSAQGRQEIITGLPSLGDHKNNGLALGPDGKLYLLQGTHTNTGVVGLDNWFLWARFFPGPRDIPCQDIALRGANFRTADPQSVIPFMRVATGAFSPFGHRSYPGQIISGEVPCNGAVLRFNPDGTDPEVVAWGLRNPFDLRFGPDGHLYTADNGPDTRGSRPFHGDDLFHRVRPGAWYGWPDYWNGKPATELVHEGQKAPPMLLAKLPGRPEKALATLGHHVAAAGFDFAPTAFGFGGQAFIAQYGTAFPATSQRPAYHGFHVVRLDTATAKVETFATNRMPGPASQIPGRGGFERPVMARFGPDGALYVLDWGHLSVTRKGPYHVPDTGVLWRISRKGTNPLPFARGDAAEFVGAGSHGGRPGAGAASVPAPAPGGSTVPAPAPGGGAAPVDPRAVLAATALMVAGLILIRRP